MYGSSKKWDAWDKWRSQKEYKDRQRIGKPVGKIVPVSHGIEQWIATTVGKKKFSEAKVLAHWSDIVGDIVAEQSRAVRLEKGKLYIIVENASWRYQLFTMKTDIIEKINAYIGKKVVNDIQFVSG